MKQFFAFSSLLFSCILFPGNLFSQPTLISGVVNDYAIVDSIDPCSNSLHVNDASAFSMGDRVLIIQMKGADIDLSSSAAFGNILNYNQAGNYEFGTVSAKNGNILSLQNLLLYDYDPSGSVQLVRVPQYGDATVIATLSALSWNGSTGGILAIEVNGTLTLDANVDVSGLGFHGGQAIDYPNSCPLFIGSLVWFTSLTSGNGAPKGEGISALPAGYEAGRGAPANGGGGGDDHNAGGGGGGNFGLGGQGGDRVAGALSCPGIGPGRGGKPLSYTSKIFPGGGGGAGHGNNMGATAGTNGGGIAIIRAVNLVGNSQVIRANGIDQTLDSQGDGAGGGGAGGSILLDVGTFTGSVSAVAQGGNGGNVNLINCSGPGGGGAGGALLVSGPAISVFLSTNVSGGNNGNSIASTSPCFNDPNGALPGSAGGVLTGLILPESTIPFMPFSVSAMVTSSYNGEDISCVGAADGTAAVMASGGSGLSYFWSNGQTAQTATGLSAGTYSVQVSDSSGCLSATASVTLSNPAPIQLTASSQSPLCAGGSDGQASATASGGTGAFSYSWSTGATNQSLGSLNAGTYSVWVTDANGCTSSTATVLTDPAAIMANFSVVNAACFGFKDGMIQAAPSGGSFPYTYQWSTGGTNQTLAGLGAGSYSLTITDANGCVLADSAVVMEPTPISLSLTSLPDSNGSGNGTATVVANGGTPPYSYSWNTLPPQSSANATGLAGNTFYTVWVTDANGCIRQDSIFLATTRLDDFFPGPENTIRLWPNPSSGSFFLDIDLEVKQALSLYLYDTNGKRVFEEDLGQIRSASPLFQIPSLSPGMYVLELRSRDWRWAERLVFQP